MRCSHTPTIRTSRHYETCENYRCSNKRFLLYRQCFLRSDVDHRGEFRGQADHGLTISTGAQRYCTGAASRRSKHPLLTAVRPETTPECSMTMSGVRSHWRLEIKSPARYRPVRVPQSIAARVICRVAALVSIESVPGTQSAQTSPVEPTARAGMFSPQIYWNMCVQCWNADTLIFSTSVPVHPMLSPGTSTKTRPTRFPLPARDGRAHWDSPLSFWHGNSLNEGKPCERSNTRITLFKKRLIPVRSERGSS